MSVTSKLKDKDVVEKIDHISDAVDVISALMIGKAPSVPVNEETVESDSHEGLSDSMKSEIKECVSAAINDVLPERVVINNEPAVIAYYRHQALHYEADHIRYESARMHLQDIEGMPEYFQYLDSVYCIPENVEKRKTCWEKARITK